MLCKVLTKFIIDCISDLVYQNKHHVLFVLKYLDMFSEHNFNVGCTNLAF